MALVPGDGPIERAGHVLDVYKRSPGRTVAQDAYVPGAHRACDEVIDHEVEA